MNDAQLVEACLEGDHRAYAILVDRYRFDAVREDADMVELVDEWERAERVGAPTTQGG